MKYFINKNGSVLSYTNINRIISLYNKEKLIFSSVTNLRNVSDVVDPIYYNDYLFLFDYEKGIEIKNEEGSKFLKICAVQMAEVYDNILLAVTHKKIIVVDYLKCEIIEQYNVSENFEFCKTNDYMLFYRIKRNKSFLYNIKLKQLIELKGIPILDIIIMKFLVKKNIIHIFFSHGFGTNQNCGVIQYNISTNKYDKIDFGSSSAYGYQFINDLIPEINDDIEIIVNDYEKLIISLINKYGVFLAFYMADEERISKLTPLESENIKKQFDDFKQIVSKYSKIHCSDDFDNLKQELEKLESKIINKE